MATVQNRKNRKYLAKTYFSTSFVSQKSLENRNKISKFKILKTVLLINQNDNSQEDVTILFANRTAPAANAFQNVVDSNIEKKDFIGHLSGSCQNTLSSYDFYLYLLSKTFFNKTSEKFGNQRDPWSLIIYNYCFYYTFRMKPSRKLQYLKTNSYCRSRYFQVTARARQHHILNLSILVNYFAFKSRRHKTASIRASYENKQHW